MMGERWRVAVRIGPDGGCRRPGLSVRVGNVLSLALMGVPVYVAPLVAPSVDLTVVGLLVAACHLSDAGALSEVLRPARRMLLGASAATLALNVTDPVLASHWGRAAFDAVGPLLLIGWSKVGPALLSAMEKRGPEQCPSHGRAHALNVRTCVSDLASQKDQRLSDGVVVDDLFRQTRLENAQHWAENRRLISTQTLRRKLHFGAARSRMVAAAVRIDDAPLASPGGF